MGWSRHHKNGLIHNSPQRSWPGYTLTATRGGNYANLLDMQGQVCHRWYSAEQINYGFLLPNGNLLARTGSAPEGQGMGGSAKSLIELDWDGNVVWGYKNPLLHHDFHRTESGSTIALVWELLPQELADSVGGGFLDDGVGPGMFGDNVIEVSQDGKTMNTWHTWEHLDPALDVICPLENRKEWTHANSISLTPDGDFLISFRQTSTIGIVDRKTGGFTWKWGPGDVSHQHHPTMLDNGNILLFDNGAHRRGMNFSRVIEIDPKTNEIAWEYQGDPPLSFYSYNISSAERFPNGNTLICEGAPGRVLEVTQGGEIVWEYISPFFVGNPPTAGGSRFGFANAVFRAHRYAEDHPAFAGKNLNPDNHANLNRLYR
ncbi:MAG: aryl-sulfate sulfotransferase [Dehalococcoidia bacterium]|nr:aryl-sulfate sulfotransferase [Dehalococcoidia bacterium]|tara:strand:- start:26 stop:1144 length:1119 start_codon:yes stop_codon:yes gene_type:complete